MEKLLTDPSVRSKQRIMADFTTRLLNGPPETSVWHRHLRGTTYFPPSRILLVEGKT